ncbi:MAG: hypothetical protein RI900_1257 [Actinomycetota bacterium]|jgi:hypothetical protein
MSTGGTPIVGVIGAGVTGSAVAAHLAAAGARVAAHDVLHGAAAAATRRLGGVVVDRVDDLMACDAVAICAPSPHAELLRRFVAEGVATVSISDDLDDLRHLLDLDDLCRRSGVAALVGAGMAPGLSGLLARHLAAQLHVVDELHVATHGTGGPACARQHHDALGSTALGWHDGEWIEPLGGSGRDLVWFPEPVEAHDCYRAALGDPLLLHRAFPDATRISARVSATRRDRMTARLPMLTPPHAEGDLGAVRVEARGAAADGARVTVIAGAAGHAAQLAAAVCAAAVLRVLEVGLPAGLHGTADPAVQALDLLHHATQLGVRVQEFTGVARPASW